MVVVRKEAYSSTATVYFQRSTVILSEGLLVYALRKYVAQMGQQPLAQVAAIGTLLSPGFLIIDHIHFQYNGFLFGIFVLSITYARRQESLLASGALFAVLLCFKHIFLYVAPAWTVYLATRYCLRRPRSLSLNFSHCFKLFAVLVGIFTAAFGPFIANGTMGALVQRLFPFSRGLCHAYWAPNVWALYSLADRLLILLSPNLQISINPADTVGSTRGLVGDTVFAVMPTITPKMAFALTLIWQSVRRCITVCRLTRRFTCSNLL